MSCHGINKLLVGFRVYCIIIAGIRIDGRFCVLLRIDDNNTLLKNVNRKSKFIEWSAFASWKRFLEDILLRLCVFY